MYSMDKTLPKALKELSVRLAPLRWGAARTAFIATIGLCLGTVIAGLPAAPLITWWMFNDWRFWRHWRRGLRLYGYGYRLLGLMFRGHGGFLLSVPLFSPPRSRPSPELAILREEWEHGTSCGPCTRCCRHGRSGACPLLDLDDGVCRGYDSFYWRYFNCGRFPSRQWDIDYYGCPKWRVKPTEDPTWETPVPSHFLARTTTHFTTSDLGGKTARVFSPGESKAMMTPASSRRESTAHPSNKENALRANRRRLGLRNEAEHL